MSRRYALTAAALSCVLFLSTFSCGGNGNGSGESPSRTWTWTSGSSTYDQLGIYYPSASAVPGARYGSAMWTDSAGHQWLFGGVVRFGNFGSSYYMNDLWRFDGTYWTWMAGSDEPFAAGVYGTQGQPDPANVPPPRAYCAFWSDDAGNLWLFGGDSDGGFFNDLWRFDGRYWTWMGGSTATQQPGVYGTMGVPDPANIPGGRSLSAWWKDGEGDIWLFGGDSPNTSTHFGRYNDLWRFDGTYWTWMAGSSSFDQLGVYGQMGTPGASNAPGGRLGGVLWTDDADNLWLFGGSGYSGTTGSRGPLNDLWRFDGTDWTWMGGSDLNSSPGVYGTMGSPDPDNIPGARHTAVSWMDGAGGLWLFGGSGQGKMAGVPGSGVLNDLWRFDGAAWTWMGGSDTVKSPGVYGAAGSPDAANIPGARRNSAACTDSAGRVWLFGGFGYDEPGNYGHLNDLWRFDP